MVLRLKFLQIMFWYVFRKILFTITYFGRRYKSFFRRSKVFLKFQLRFEQQLRHERLAINLWYIKRVALRKRKWKANKMNTWTCIKNEILEVIYQVSVQQCFANLKSPNFLFNCCLCPNQNSFQIVLRFHFRFP